MAPKKAAEKPAKSPKKAAAKKEKKEKGEPSALYLACRDMSVAGCA
jgi:hypothetical protein